ncbi:MAG: hypothetical protein ACLS7Z_01570 [Christensenellales bacterium]
MRRADAAGRALVCAPVAAYLAVNGALGACVEVYFVQNLFDYSGMPMSLTGHVYNALAYLRTQSVINPAVTVLVALGAGFVLLDAAQRHERGWFWQALALPMGAGLLLLTCYWGEMAHPYYALAFAGLCAPGLIPLAWLERAEARAVCVDASRWWVLAVTPTCMGLCRAVPLMRSESDMPQTVFVEMMNRGKPDPAGYHLSGSGVLSGGGHCAELPIFCRQQFADKGEKRGDCVVSGRGQNAVCRHALRRSGRTLCADCRSGRRVRPERHAALQTV